MNNKNHNLSHFLSMEKLCHQHTSIIVFRLIPSWQYEDASRRMRDNNHNNDLRWRGRWARWCRLRPNVEAAQHWGDRQHHHQHKKNNNFEVIINIIINIKKNNFEVIVNIIINIINFEVTFNQRCEMRKSYKYVRVTCFLSVLILGVLR